MATLFDVVLLIVVYHTATAWATVIVKPAVTEVVVGQSVYFNCHSLQNQNVSWVHKKAVAGAGQNGAAVNENGASTSTDNGVAVYENGHFISACVGRCHLDDSNPNAYKNLGIRNVTVEDAGTYQCQVGAELEYRSPAKIIVLETPPLCISNLHTDHVVAPHVFDIPSNKLNLSCSVTFHGDEPAILEWVDDNGETVNSGVSVVTHGNVIISTLILDEDSSTVTGSYTCKAKRSQQGTRSCSYGPFKVYGQTATSSGWKVFAILLICLFLVLLVVAGILFFKKRSRLGRSSGKKKKREANIVLEELTVDALPKDSKDVLMQLLHSANNENVELRNEVRNRESMIDQLDVEKQHLENRLYASDASKYGTKLELTGTVDTSANADAKAASYVTGIAVYDKELFVVMAHQPQVDVYYAKSLQHKHKLNRMKGFIPLDIASCVKIESLFLCCENESKKNKEVIKISQSGTPVKNWSIGNCESTISVHRDGIVIVSSSQEKLIKEYSHVGQLIQTINLPTDSGINHIWHAIKTTRVHYVLSHGDTDDPLHRICVVGRLSDGKIGLMKSYGNKKGSDIDKQQMNRPVYMVEDSKGNIIVADMKNNRVLMLTSALECKRELVSGKSCGLRFPMRCCLDENNGRLLVADCDFKKNALSGGRILVFNTNTK